MGREYNFNQALETVRENARAQATDEHRNNYLLSCSNHGNELVQIVEIVRAEIYKGFDFNI